MLAWIRKRLKPRGDVIENKTAELCVGCQQAMLRISHGAQETHCPVCGCRWMSKEAADMYKVQHHEPTPRTINGRAGGTAVKFITRVIGDKEIYGWGRVCSDHIDWTTGPFVRERK